MQTVQPKQHGQVVDMQNVLREWTGHFPDPWNGPMVEYRRPYPEHRYLEGRMLRPDGTPEPELLSGEFEEYWFGVPEEKIERIRGVEGGAAMLRRLGL
jgi:hypothetical protein